MREAHINKHLSIPGGKIDGPVHLVSSFVKKACPGEQWRVPLESPVRRCSVYWIVSGRNVQDYQYLGTVWSGRSSWGRLTAATSPKQVEL